MKPFNLQEALDGAEIIGIFDDKSEVRFSDLKYWNTSKLIHKLYLITTEGALWRFNDDGESEYGTMQLFLTAK